MGDGMKIDWLVLFGQNKKTGIKSMEPIGRINLMKNTVGNGGK
jgi:hypothetical protein